MDNIIIRVKSENLNKLYSDTKKIMNPFENISNINTPSTPSNFSNQVIANSVELFDLSLEENKLKSSVNNQSIVSSNVTGDVDVKIYPNIIEKNIPTVIDTTQVSNQSSESSSTYSSINSSNLSSSNLTGGFNFSIGNSNGSHISSPTRSVSMTNSGVTNKWEIGTSNSKLRTVDFQNMPRYYSGGGSEKKVSLDKVTSFSRGYDGSVGVDIPEQTISENINVSEAIKTDFSVNDDLDLGLLKSINKEINYHQYQLELENYIDIQEQTLIIIETLKSNLDNLIAEQLGKNFEDYTGYEINFEKLKANGYDISDHEQLKAELESLNSSIIELNYYIEEANKVFLLLPYQEIIASESYQNYKNGEQIIERDFLINSVGSDGNSFSYNKYLEKQNISPLDFYNGIVNSDEYSAMAYLLTENNFDVGRLQDLIRVSDLNPDLSKCYNYIFYTEGIEKANEYLEIVEEEINKSISIHEASEFLKTLPEGCTFEEANARFLKLTGKGISDGVGIFFEGIRSWLDSSTKKSKNDYLKIYISYALLPNEQKKQLGLITETGESSINPELIDFTIDYSGKLNISDDVYAISSSVGNILPSMLIAMLNPTLGTVSMGVSNGGNSYRQAMVEGSNRNTAILYGILSGTTAASLEKLLGTIPGLGNTKSLAFQSTLKNLLSSITKEGFQESLEEFVEILLDYIIYNKTITLEEGINRLGKSAIYGVIISGILNTPSAFLDSTGNIKLNSVNFNQNIQLREIALNYGIYITEREATNLLEEIN